MPQVQTVDLGLEFINTNHAEDNWFVQIETFDPREPFFTQPEYQQLYPDKYDGPLFDWPAYGRVSETPEQVEHLRRRYAALVSMCDTQLGRVLDAMDQHNLWDDTLFFVCTDHGFMLGEHDWWAKVSQLFFQEIAHIPLFVWVPCSGRRSERRSSLGQLIDIPATLLAFFDVRKPKDMQGCDLQAVIKHDEPVSQSALFGIHGGHVNITDGRYVYMRAPETAGNQPLFEYTLMPTHMDNPFTPDELRDAELVQPFSFSKQCPLMKIPARPWVNPFPFGTLLYDIICDPNQVTSLKDSFVEECMIVMMIHLMKANDAPKDNLTSWGLLVYD